jgi:hypothetical protein
MGKLKIMLPFDRSRIPAEVQKQNAALLDRLEAGAIVLWQDPAYRWATACHEGAHAYYRKKVGATGLKFIGPHFVYDAATREIYVGAAGISSEFAKFLSFRDMARYCVAGYIWESFLTNSEEDPKGAAIDKRVFWDDVRRFHSSVTDTQIEATWQWGEVEVRKDLNDKKIRKSIVALAHKFEKWLLDQKGETHERTHSGRKRAAGTLRA